MAINLLKKFFIKKHLFFSQKKQRGVRILLFHDIRDDQMQTFKEFISFIHSQYRFITHQEYEDASKADELTWLLSFDDGFSSQRTITEEILDPLGIKALFFICSEYVGLPESEAKKFFAMNMRRGDAKNDWSLCRPMTVKNLIHLSEKGHVIGGHTGNHIQLSQSNSKSVLEKEIISSGDALEEKLQTEIKWFAYPFGDIGSISDEALNVIDKRYHYSCSGLRGINNAQTSPLCIRRECVDLNSSMDDLKSIALGALDCFYYFKRKKLDAMPL